MKFILADITHEISEIETKMKGVKDTKEEMKGFIGKPFYKTCEEIIERWEKEIEEHYVLLDYFYLKLKEAKRLT